MICNFLSNWVIKSLCNLKERNKSTLITAIHHYRHLVNESHHVSISPSSFVQVIRLLQHFRQLLASNVSVGLAPSLNCGWKKSVTNTESSRNEYIGCWGVSANIITIKITILKHLSNRFKDSRSSCVTLRRTKSCWCITSFPSIIGKNSLYVICWTRAATICLDSWKIVSSSQCGLILPSSAAILLCSLTNNVWTMARTVCSLTLGSPARKQYTSSPRQQ